MNTLFSYLFNIRAPKFVALAATAGAFSFASNAASAWPFIERTTSPLPIESSGSTARESQGFRASESKDKLYVTGSIKKRPGNTLLSHVDVQLVDAKGRVVAEERESISYGHPRTGAGKTGRSAFVVSFPLTEARQAAKVVVRYHSTSHGS